MGGPAEAACKFLLDILGQVITRFHSSCSAATTKRSYLVHPKSNPSQVLNTRAQLLWQSLSNDNLERGFAINDSGEQVTMSPTNIGQVARCQTLSFFSCYQGWEWYVGNELPETFVLCFSFFFFFI